MPPGTSTLFSTWLIASIGTPAAIRPISGNSTEAPPPTGIAPRGAPRRSPSITCGVKPACLPSVSGSLTISMARARCASRRMKPRSSSAVISRWMPDFERRSSASFISSNEGGTPSRRIRLLMKSSNSSCFLVSMASQPLSSARTMAAPFGVCSMHVPVMCQRSGNYIGTYSTVSPADRAPSRAGRTSSASASASTVSSALSCLSNGSIPASVRRARM